MMPIHDRQFRKEDFNLIPDWISVFRDKIDDDTITKSTEPIFQCWFRTSRIRMKKKKATDKGSWVLQPYSRVG